MLYKCLKEVCTCLGYYSCLSLKEKGMVEENCSINSHSLGV